MSSPALGEWRCRRRRCHQPATWTTGKNGGVLLTIHDLRRRRSEINDVASRRGVRELLVFGSVARGDSRPASDVDFLAEFEPGRSLLDQVHLIEELGVLLGTPVDVVARGGLLERDNTSSTRPYRFDSRRRTPDSRHPRSCSRARHPIAGVLRGGGRRRPPADRLVEVIGEAARAMSPEAREAHADLDWTGFIGLRNVLVHAYHRIQPGLLWQAAAVDVPKLAEALED